MGFIMKILYVGGGYVGACSAAVSADSGHEIVIYDIDKTRIDYFSSFSKEKIEYSLYEYGLADLFVKNKERIKFTFNLDNIREYLNQAQVIFMCLPTPEKDESGETDLSYYENALSDIAKILVKRNNSEQSQYVLIVNKSTVPLGMSARAKELLDQFGVKNYGIGSNPEFLVEGKAIEGSTRPSRVVVGAWQENDFQIFREIYKRFCDSPNTSYIEVNPVEAEAGKLMANFILFNRLANCFNVVGRTCEKFNDLHFENIRKILISDNRIGNWGFYDSLFAGGSCYIKDARSLSFQLKEKEVNTDIINDTLAANERQIENFLQRPEKELNFDWQTKKVGIMGLAFKRDTNDIRNSGAIKATKFFIDKNVSEIRAFDPAAGDNYKKYFNDNEKVVIYESKKDMMKKINVLVIATDWPEFRELTPEIISNLPKGALIMDGRRMLQHQYQDLAEAGYNIIAVGSPLIKGARLESN